MERGQAERLLPLLGEALAAGGAEWRDLDAIAVCTGPGNFTGLRIAVAAARGLAFGLGIPAIGVTRLEALAHGRAGAVLVALGVGRGGFAVQLFEDGRAVGAPALVPAERLAEAAPHAVRVGAQEGAAEARADPLALARIALGRLGTPQPPPAPLYLRPADAAPAAEPPPLILDDA